MRSLAKNTSVGRVSSVVDPSLGPASLGIGTSELMTDLNALGLHYESLVIRDLRIYAQPLDARVESWRDASGHEVDVVVSVGPSKWGAFEVKLSPDAVDEAAAALLHFKAKVDTSRQGEPACLGVHEAHESMSTGDLRRHRAQDGRRARTIGASGAVHLRTWAADA